MAKKTKKTRVSVKSHYRTINGKRVRIAPFKFTRRARNSK